MASQKSDIAAGAVAIGFTQDEVWLSAAREQTCAPSDNVRINHRCQHDFRLHRANQPRQREQRATDMADCEID
jgi:hypothetical protein